MITRSARPRLKSRGRAAVMPRLHATVRVRSRKLACPDRRMNSAGIRKVICKCGRLVNTNMMSTATIAASKGLFLSFFLTLFIYVFCECSSTRLIFQISTFPSLTLKCVKSVIAKVPHLYNVCASVCVCSSVTFHFISNHI